MTGKILNFPKIKKFARPDISYSEVFSEVNVETLANWQLHATTDTLNKFIRSKISTFAKGEEAADYVGNLNVLSDIEQKLGMKIIMSYREDAKQFGWRAGFYKEQQIFSSADFIVINESYARAFNILLFVGVESRMAELSS